MKNEFEKLLYRIGKRPLVFWVGFLIGIVTGIILDALIMGLLA